MQDKQKPRVIIQTTVQQITLYLRGLYFERLQDEPLPGNAQHTSDTETEELPVLLSPNDKYFNVWDLKNQRSSTWRKIFRGWPSHKQKDWGWRTQMQLHFLFLWRWARSHRAVCRKTEQEIEAVQTKIQNFQWPNVLSCGECRWFRYEVICTVFISFVFVSHLKISRKCRPSIKKINKIKWKKLTIHEP